MGFLGDLGTELGMIEEPGAQREARSSPVADSFRIVASLLAQNARSGASRRRDGISRSAQTEFVGNAEKTQNGEFWRVAQSHQSFAVDKRGD